MLSYPFDQYIYCGLSINNTTGIQTNVTLPCCDPIIFIQKPAMTPATFFNALWYVPLCVCFCVPVYVFVVRMPFSSE